jgi:hypothetical protein
MTSIQNTIATTLPSVFGSPAYGEYVSEVVDALTEREYQLSEAIIAGVVGHFGVTPDQVKVRLEGLGMAVRPEPTPEPEPEVDVAELELAFASDDSTATSGEKAPVKVKKDKSVKSLAKRIKALEKLAKDHGLL